MARHRENPNYEAPTRNLGVVGNTFLVLAGLGTLASIGIQESQLLPPAIEQTMFIISLCMGGLGLAAKTGKKITEENR